VHACRAATCTPRGVTTAAPMPCSGRTQRQAALPAGLDRAQEPSWPPSYRRELRHPVAAAGKPTRGTAETSRVRIPRCPHKPAQLRGVHPFASHAILGTGELLPDWIKQEPASAGVQTIIYYPIPDPASRLCLSGYGPAPAGHRSAGPPEVLKPADLPELTADSTACCGSGAPRLRPSLSARTTTTTGALSRLVANQFSANS